jgi:hypothetical protein
MSPNPKIIVIGEENKTVSQKKPIEILSAWSAPESIRPINESRLNIHDYNFVELVAKDYLAGFDLIFCYYDTRKRGDGCVFLGHWNDGVL